MWAAIRSARAASALRAACPVGAGTYPRRYSRRILLVVPLSVASVASAVYNELPANVACAAGVLGSSVNYWRWPVFGWGRSADIAVVSASLFYQLAVTAPRAPPAGRDAYVAASTAGVVCYGVARHACRRLGRYNVASALHVGVHVFGNIGNLCLYDSLGANWLGLRCRAPETAAPHALAGGADG